MNHTINNDFSDHSLILSEIDYSCEIHDYQVSSCIDYKRFRERMELFLVEEDCDELDVNSYCNFLIQAFNTAEADATVEQKVKKRKKDLLCSWYNSELNELRNYKTNLIKRIKRMDRRNLNSDILKYKLKTISNVIISKSRNLKSSYYQNLYRDCSDNSRETWRNINKILGSKKASKDVNKIVVNEVEISDSHKMSDEFNVYYSNVASKLLEQKSRMLY